MDVPYDKRRNSSIPYQWATTSFSANRDVEKAISTQRTSCSTLRAELAGKIDMLDSQGEVIALASLHLGTSQCSTDRDQLKALDDLLQSAESNWVSFNSDTAKEVLVSGDAAAGMIFNGFSAKARAEGASISMPIQNRASLLGWTSRVVERCAATVKTSSSSWAFCWYWETSQN